MENQDTNNDGVIDINDTGFADNDSNGMADGSQNTNPLDSRVEMVFLIT